MDEPQQTEAPPPAGPDWLQLAQDAYQGSTSYFDSSIRRQLEQDIRQFNSEHPQGSKYLHDSYRLRSRLFRPKTRGAIRKNEAVAAEALFSTQDVISIKPANESSPRQRAAAALWQEVMQHRLTISLPWFLLAIGAYQEAQAVGVVISYQGWDKRPSRKVDQPCIDLIPPENFRFDPGAKWYDPINTSPYLVHMIPMYVKDVRARMLAQQVGGRAPWKQVTEEQLTKATSAYTDSTRQSREGPQRQDPQGNQTTRITAYTLVWVHRNVIENDGVDYVYYTLSDIEMLSEPVPLEQEYAHGLRPFVMGFCALEAHKLYPCGVARLGRDVQQEINDITNLRLDNVRFVLNKRYFVRRGRAVDLRALTRNAPGAAVLMDNPQEGDGADVRIVDYQDVTSSSYQEQDRLNVDFDEVAGAFSPASIQSNRKLNETVGGMNILTTNANQVQAYQLKTWVETWAEPVLRQVLALEQQYETDEGLLLLAAEKANLTREHGVTLLDDPFLTESVHLTIGIGMGATNPTEIVNQLLASLQTLRDILADGTLEQHGMVVDEVIKEVFGKLGYADGRRFFDAAGGDLRVLALTNKVQQLQQALAAKHPPELILAQVAKLEAEVRALQVKDAETHAKTIKTGTEAVYSAMQAAQVAAAVPAVAPVADAMIEWAGGDDINTVSPPGGVPQGMTVRPLLNPRTGVEIQQAGAGEGVREGIETVAADGVQA